MANKSDKQNWSDIPPKGIFTYNTSVFPITSYGAEIFFLISELLTSYGFPNKQWGRES